LIGHDLFRTSARKFSSEGMDKIGSKPSPEIGGSSLGWAARRMRPRRRASEKANSVIVSDDLSSICKMNYPNNQLGSKCRVGG